MKPVMYLFANAGLGMSPGKLAAQVAHAAVEAYRASLVTSGAPNQETNLTRAWHKSGYTKLVMEARDETHLRNIKDYLADKGFESVLIIDEGRTEISPHTPTALGVPIVDKDNEIVQFAFKDFRTLKPPKPEAKKTLSASNLFGKLK